MSEFFSSAYLPPLAMLIEHIPADLSLTTNPQETLLTNGQSAQVDSTTLEQDQSQLNDFLYLLNEWSYSSDAWSSCYTEPDAYQESFNLSEEDCLYENIYTSTTDAIKEFDTAPLAPPLIRNASIMSFLDNHQPPNCHADLDLSFEPYESDIENLYSVNLWTENHYSDSDILSVEALSDEEVTVVVPKKKNKEKQEKKKVKRTRKNYSADTVDILMNWYLSHDGVVPTNSQKKMLAGKTGKTEKQIGTWFLNAKKRYIHKLQKYKSLSSEHPDLAHDYRTLKSFLKMKK